VVFLEHPWRFDDRGWVRVVDRSGGEKTLAGEYWGVEGLAWAADGARILYSAAAGQNRYRPYSVSLSDGMPPRQEFPVVGSVLVQDIATDGRWIVLRVDERVSIRAHLPNTEGERDFSWLNGGDHPELSRDASLLLFTDSSESAGSNYAVTYRNTSGGAAVRLGDGISLGLSPDGVWALALMPSAPDLRLYPMGPGTLIHLPRGPMTHYDNAAWFPDSRRIVLCGSETGRAPRCYEQSISGGPPKPMTAEGAIAGRISPDGRTLAAQQTDGKWIFATIQDGAAHPLPQGPLAAAFVVGWAADSRSVYLQAAGTPARIDRVALSSGTRTRVLEIAPPERAGLTEVGVDSFRDDGTYAYWYTREPTTIFIVSGVHSGR
jgi:Tol biopolymer transport system component